MDEKSTGRNVLLWKENIQESRKRIRHRLVRSGRTGRMDRTDRMMWMVQPDEDGDGRMKMGTNPDITPLQRCSIPMYR